MYKRNKLNLERTDKIRDDLLNYFKDNYTDTDSYAEIITAMIDLIVSISVWNIVSDMEEAKKMIIAEFERSFDAHLIEKNKEDKCQNGKLEV